jgi:hypothetical protein
MRRGLPEDGRLIGEVKQETTTPAAASTFPV